MGSRSICFTAFLSMLVVVALLMPGCGSKANPEDTVSSWWNAVSGGDVDAAAQYYSSSIDTGTALQLLPLERPAATELISTLFKKMSLTITGHSADGDGATVTAVLSHPNFRQTIKDIGPKLKELTGSSSEGTSMTRREAIRQLLPDIIRSIRESPQVQSDVQFSLVWEGGAWKISEDPLTDLREAFRSLGDQNQ